MVFRVQCVYLKSSMPLILSGSEPGRSWKRRTSLADGSRGSYIAEDSGLGFIAHLVSLYARQISRVFHISKLIRQD